MDGEAKQFRLLDGRPTVCWAARALLGALAGPVVVVLPADRLDLGEALLRGHLGDDASRVRVAAGGVRRQDSVAAGLTLIEGARTVLVHDAARPFASSGLVERVGRRATQGRAVIPALPIHDTLKEIDGDRITATHDRERFVLAQTPQGFPTQVLEQAHAKSDGAEATDDARLCESLGVPVFWIEGEPLNRKLTATADWEWAEEMIDRGHVRWL
jgi:2-C-methyl-D-erythritol 4-phosphate cytidylyltransferase/2-C-methyl-D-erythritol 2,4-cyclodiphosphate synthase